MKFQATYSPDDNKIRLTASERLPADLYHRVRDAGYIWAPQQKIFIAPAWTPAREDIALELAGEIGDEDTTLAERAEVRAERFEDYSDKRLNEAKRAREEVAELSEQFAGGQPILIGHHSEKRARKDQERIQNGMRKSIRLWDTSTYWTRRAAGAISHAKYKELPRTRMRRIKRLQADMRKQIRAHERSGQSLAMWTHPPMNPQRAMSMRYCQIIKIGDTGRTGYDLISSALQAGERTADIIKTIREQAMKAYAASMEHEKRWIAHYENRLAYETAMLAESGHAMPAKVKRDLLPICNYRAGSFQIENRYHRGEFKTYPQVEMTAAEFQAIHADMRGTRIVEQTHRIRIFIRNGRHAVAFLTDSKVHPKPEPIAPGIREASDEKIFKNQYLGTFVSPARPPESPDKAEFEALRKAEKAGVQIVVADQLFPTPEWVAEEMAGKLDIRNRDLSILEPSAGTGRLIDAVIYESADSLITAVEINPGLCQKLKGYRTQNVVRVIQDDFMQLSAIGQFDRVIMNPPFSNGADIRHIKRAFDLLRPGGRLVALCANGPRQQADLKPFCVDWLPLPAGTFAETGTNVSVAMLIMDR